MKSDLSFFIYYVLSYCFVLSLDPLNKRTHNFCYSFFFLLQLLLILKEDSYKPNN